MNGILAYILALHPDTVYMINKTGAASVKGEVVTVHGSVDNAVAKIAIDTANPIGVFEESGIPDGVLAPIKKSGIADVYFIGNATRGHLARTFITGDDGFVAGQALSEPYPTAPFATDKHAGELGHCLESRTGPGLAKCMLHFN